MSHIIQEDFDLTKAQGAELTSLFDSLFFNQDMGELKNLGNILFGFKNFEILKSFKK